MRTSGSVEDRYCAEGEQCTQYPNLGKPSKLRAGNESIFCESCRRAKLDDAVMGVRQPRRSSPEAGPKTPRPRGTSERPEKLLSSSADAEIRVLKAKLVLSLFLKRGQFWELVEEMRRRWDVVPREQVPPSEAFPHDELEDFIRNRREVAEGSQKSYAALPLPHWTPRHVLNRYEEDSDEWCDGVMRWGADIRRVQKQTVPEHYRDEGGPGDWDRFIAACVLYDPPETELLKFASFSDPEPQSLLGDEEPGNASSKETFHMLFPPIKTLQALVKTEYWVWDCVMFVLGESLKSLFPNPESLLASYEREFPELVNEYHRRARQRSTRYYIEVNESTTWEDVNSAYRMIHNLRPKGTQGAPPRNRLVAVQCAILYDRHNERDASDHRRKEWSHERLKEEFGLPSERTARDYVKLGRNILKEI